MRSDVFDPLMVDASISVAWWISAESSDLTDRVLIAAARAGILVPAIWWLEVTNTTILGPGRGRLESDDWSRFEQMLSTFRVETDPLEPEHIFTKVAQLSRQYGLTTYDASYLELAIRRGARLATLDKAVNAAANRAGIALFNPEVGT